MTDTRSSHPGDSTQPPNGQGAVCFPLSTNVVSDVINFHAQIPASLQPLPEPSSGSPAHDIACTIINSGRVGFGIEVLLRQTWRWQGQSLGAPQATISLAPGEERLIEVSTVRRRLHTEKQRLTTETTAQSESSDSTRSSANVTQTSARRRNWSVATNGRINFKAGKVGVELDQSFNLENSVERTEFERYGNGERRGLEIIRAIAIP